jgi:hypothetical protein
MCNKHYCFACRAIFHVGMTCEEYYVDSKVNKDDTQFHALAATMQFK